MPSNNNGFADMADILGELSVKGHNKMLVLGH